MRVEGKVINDLYIHKQGVAEIEIQSPKRALGLSKKNLWSSLEDNEDRLQIAD